MRIGGASVVQQQLVAHIREYVMFFVQSVRNIYFFLCLGFTKYFVRIPLEKISESQLTSISIPISISGEIRRTRHVAGTTTGLKFASGDIVLSGANLL